MARVLLLKPARLRAYQPSLVPPMGLLYLAAVLKARGRHEVRIFDARLHRQADVRLARELRHFAPEVVGISALTFETRPATAMVQAVRAWDVGCPIMIGGPQATAAPELTLATTCADAAVVGEAEEIVVPLVEALLARERPGLPGVLWRGEQTAAMTPAPLPDLDALPLPAWDLVDLEAYARRPSMASTSPWHYATIVTSRGCPWRCVYCHSIHGKRLRKRSLENVAAELELLQRRLGSGVIEVLDDNFNADQDRGKAILDLFCRTEGRLRPAFPNGVRSDRLDEESLDLMARSRTAFVSFAIETADEDMQRQIRKNLDLRAARRAIEGAHARGLYTNGFFMLGFPGETLVQMRRTLAFAHSVPLTGALFFRVVPMPGTDLWNSFQRLQPDAFFEPDDYFQSTVNLSSVPDAVVAALHRFAQLSFYARPAVLVRLLRRHPNRPALLRRAVSLLQIVSGVKRNVLCA